MLYQGANLQLSLSGIKNPQLRLVKPSNVDLGLSDFGHPLPTSDIDSTNVAGLEKEMHSHPMASRNGRYMDHVHQIRRDLAKGCLFFKI